MIDHATHRTRRGFRVPDAFVQPVALLLAGAFLTCSFLACSQERQPGGRGPQGPVPVSAVAAAREDVPLEVRAVGNVEGSNTVSIQARVGGELARVCFEEGSDVRQGDLLFVIDPRLFDAALRGAEAALARDRARAVSARAQAERFAELVTKDYVTKQQFDDAQAEAAAAEATVLADSAAVESARLNLGYCSIRAPIAGRTGNVQVRQGNLVKANDEPLVTIEQLVPVRVAFGVPEPWLAQIRRYAASGDLEVRARLAADTTRTFVGNLTFIDNAIDEGTGTILLKATFPNEDRALWPGQFVDVFVDLTTRHDAVVVPSSAVQQGQQGSYIWVIGADQTASMRPVTLGPSVGNRVVIEQGLQAQEQVITGGQLRLVPGAKVTLKAAPGPGQAAPGPGQAAPGPGQAAPGPGQAAPGQGGAGR
jgi:multidrug efflux system membrane fusion protein